MRIGVICIEFFWWGMYLEPNQIKAKVKVYSHLSKPFTDDTINFD